MEISIKDAKPFHMQNKKKISLNFHLRPYGHFGAFLILIIDRKVRKIRFLEKHKLCRQFMLK